MRRAPRASWLGRGGRSRTTSPDRAARVLVEEDPLVAEVIKGWVSGRLSSMAAGIANHVLPGQGFAIHQSPPHTIHQGAGADLRPGEGLTEGPRQGKDQLVSNHESPSRRSPKRQGLHRPQEVVLTVQQRQPCEAPPAGLRPHLSGPESRSCAAGPPIMPKFTEFRGLTNHCQAQPLCQAADGAHQRGSCLLHKQACHQR